MPEFVEIAVNLPGISDVYDYHLPPELEGKLQPGHLVQVPFGQQQVQGIVCRMLAQPTFQATRPVSALLDLQPVTTPLYIQLAQELSLATLAPLAACIGLLIPSGLDQQADSIYTLQIGKRLPGSLTPTQKRLLQLLEQRGPLRGSQIDRALPRMDWRVAARSLVDKGCLMRQPYLSPPTVRPKLVRTAQLLATPGEARAQFPRLGRSDAVRLRRQAMLELLIREGTPQDVSWVYAESGGDMADLQKLAEMGLVILGSQESIRNPLKTAPTGAFPRHVLTVAQQECWDQILEGLAELQAGQGPAPMLLHGVTGSGKTELYLRAVEACLSEGRQATILVPEIALTPQTVHRFLARFPGKVGLLHSQLSQGERYDTWRRIRQGEIQVVVGPRSALFAPFPSPGLIVLDECHDDSYYQDEPPFYDARQAALILARLAGALCIMGSATPDVDSAYQAYTGHWRYIHLPERVRAHTQVLTDISLATEQAEEASGNESLDLPPVEIVDMRRELQNGNRSMFSVSLQSALAQVLEKGQQAILFLNRRGTATHVFCRDCGHVLKCPRCDIPLTFHSPQQALVCHRCGYQRRMPAACPACKGTRIRQLGAGTERVEAELVSLFPQARTIRWDHETTRKKGAHEQILASFAAHRADVLVGTQMLAKGLDLPLVTLVGVVLADAGLHLPDFRAAERTFQLLTQVAGRAGRSPLGGQVILQTFQPEHYAIQAAAGHDYQLFYQQELDYRRQLRYPPFSHLVRLEYRHAHEEKAEAAARKLAEQLQAWIKDGGYRATDLIGPVPCFFTRVAGMVRWQIVLRGPDPARLLRGRQLPDWRIEVDPPSLL